MFRIFIINAIFALILFSDTVDAKPLSTKGDEFKSVKKIEKIDNFFQSGDTFFGGQPNLETLEWLQGEGVDLIINLRSDEEMKAFAKTSFNEEKIAKKLGMEYISVPISGVDSYTPENLDRFAKAMSEPHKKVLVHCRSCGRVSYFMIAYLNKYKNYSLGQAVDFGKQLKFNLLLENLLDKQFSYDFKKSRQYID